MMVMKMVNMQNWEAGKRVACPKCGREGVAAVDRFKAGGREYFYYVVRHYEGRKVRRCVVARADGPAPAAETPKPSPQVPQGPRADERDFDRATWYAVKFAMAWGCVRASPTEETYREFVNICKQIRDRVGVDVSTAEAAVTEFYVKKNKDAAIVATNAVKEVVKKVIAKVAGTETATQPAQPAPQPVFNIDEIRKVVREEVAKAVETIRIPQAPEVRVEVPREVVETIAAVRNQIAALQRDLEYVKEQVRQRKGTGARAVVRGERRIEFREGNLYWMIAQIMKQGGEWTKEAIVDEIKRK
ncbi:MAG: hypothetical protein LM580_12355, partial [Thermofilum sp.]|nr:hypothetical protein [Thermofilum sp.]